MYYYGVELNNNILAYYEMSQEEYEQYVLIVNWICFISNNRLNQSQIESKFSEELKRIFPTKEEDIKC